MTKDSNSQLETWVKSKSVNSEYFRYKATNKIFCCLTVLCKDMPSNS
ncbi:MAG: hypothetical protein Q8Q47_04135 [Ignavibacteriaceae bacterium]|nr:hypothetical protein [Ignavibacteriaceae bacterium]